MITSTLADFGPVGGTLGVTVDGGANWILTGNNLYTGTTTSGGGALGIGGSTALGAVTAPLQLGNGNIYAYGADRTVTNPVAQFHTTHGFQGDYSLAFGVLENQATIDNNAINNNIVTGKSLTFAGMTANALTADRNWAVDGSGLTIINGGVTSSTAFGLNLTKNGDGILQLNGSGAAFSGTTVINRGTVLANNISGSALGTSNVLVNTTGIFGGTGGLISGGVTLAGGMLSPGASIGELTVGSAGGTGSFFVEYNSTANTIDKLNVTGGLNLDSYTLNFADLGAGSLVNPSYIFATYGSLAGTTNTFSSIVGTPSGYFVNYAFGGNNIAIVAVPEPSTLALLTLAVVGAGFYRRSRKPCKKSVQP